MEAGLMTTSEDSGIILDPQKLEPKFLEAERTLEQIIKDGYLKDGVDTIVDDITFRGGTDETADLEAFLKDAATTWNNFINGTVQESLLPVHSTQRDIFLAYDNIFGGYGDNIRKLALKTVHPLNMYIFQRIYNELPAERKHSEQALADALRKSFFDADGNPASVFLTNSIVIKSLCISTIDYVYKECQRIIKTNEKFDFSNITRQVSHDIFSQSFIPMLQGPLTNSLIPFSLKNAQVYGTKNKYALFMTKEGHKIKVEKFEEIIGTLGPSAQKIFWAACAHLQRANYYRGKNITQTVQISLVEYGLVRGFNIEPQKMETEEEQRKENARAKSLEKYFKRSIRDDLHDISQIVVSGEVKKGRERGDYIDMRLISDHSISRGVITISFGVATAKYLVDSYPMLLPRVLISTDDRKANAINLGFKIALHNGMDTNYNAGTNHTISVQSLLYFANNIPTYEELTAKNQRNWKDKIKKPLENALDYLVTVGYLQSWKYRHTQTKKTLSKENAQNLRWSEYEGLMVDFIVIAEPDQTERRLARATEKEIAAKKREAAGEKPKRKRGRPRKATSTAAAATTAKK